MSYRIVRSLDEATWRDFVSHHPQANIFHTPEMYTVYSQAHGHSPSLWAAVDETNSPLVLFLPVRVTLHNGLFYPWTTRAVAYGSVLCSPGTPHPDALSGLLRSYVQNAGGRFLFTELRNLSPTSEIQPELNECDFIYEDHLDYLVDLDQPENSLWHRLSKSCRQRIRIAESKGVVIEEVTEPHKLVLAYQLLQGLYARVRVPLAPLSLFQAAHKICGPHGMCKVFLARLDDHYIGSAFNLLYNGRILAWYSAVDRTFSSYNPGELLKWHVFQWGQANGYHLFDFGGAGKPNEAYGPREFKAKFGGELVNYGRNTCIHSPARLQISKSLYAFARKASLFSASAGEG